MGGPVVRERTQGREWRRDVHVDDAPGLEPRDRDGGRQAEIERMAREAAYLPPAVAVAGFEAGGVVDVDVPPPLPPLSSFPDEGTAPGPGEVVP